MDSWSEHNSNPIGRGTFSSHETSPKKEPQSPTRTRHSRLVKFLILKSLIPGNRFVGPPHMRSMEHSDCETVFFLSEYALKTRSRAKGTKDRNKAFLTRSWRVPRTETSLIYLLLIIINKNLTVTFWRWCGSWCTWESMMQRASTVKHRLSSTWECPPPTWESLIVFPEPIKD